MSLPLLMRRIRYTFNSVTPPPTIMTNNLAHLLEQTALKFPEKEAFRCLDRSFTYADLNRKADQLASFLMERGMHKGDRVAVYMNRCIETSIAVYGILKAGGAFVAVNPFLPHNRTLEIMTDCGIEYLITTSSQKNKIKALADRAHFLKNIIGISEESLANGVSWETVFSSSASTYNPSEILELDLASILYTSGSTGTPKGIMHTHKSLLNLARLEANLHHSTPEDRIGNFAPLYFDQSLFGFFSGPLVGATTVIFPDAYVKLPASLAALVAKERISLWFSVPHILSQILLHGNIDEHDFSALRWVRFGGEVFPVKQLRELMTKWPHAKFINSYGPSELGRCTYYILEEPPKTDDPIPLGTVWGNTEYKILDEENTEVKKGEPGELVVRTATLMEGYWNNSALTEKAFFRVKVAEGYDYVYYRTGDLVCENEKGELMFLGRIDRQIKLRGYRIELNEIEAALLKHEDVEEAAVIMVSDKNEKELEAVVRLVEGAQVDPKELLLFCKDRIPPYAVPHQLTVMEDFPRTGSGKIDKKEIIKMLGTKVL